MLRSRGAPVEEQETSSDDANGGVIVKVFSVSSEKLEDNMTAVPSGEKGSVLESTRVVSRSSKLYGSGVSWCTRSGISSESRALMTGW